MPRGRPREFDIDKALDSALLLFWRHGYEGTSLAALSEVMGVNMPSLYAAFESKEVLFRKALERYLQGPASYLPTALREPTAHRAAQKLFAGAIDLAMNPRHPDGCLLVQGALSAGPGSMEICKQLSMVRAAAESAVRQRFQRAVDEGDLPRGADAVALARYIVTIIWGMSVQAAGGANRAQLEQVAKMALRSWPKKTFKPRSRPRVRM